MNTATPKFTVSKGLLERLGLTNEDLSRLEAGWFSRLELSKQTPLPQGPGRNDYSTATLRTTLTQQADGTVELSGLNLQIDTETVFPRRSSRQQFILDYAALCEQSGLFVATDCLPGVYLDLLGNLNHSRSLVALITDAVGLWCPELKLLFLKHAVNGDAVHFTGHRGLLGIAENVSPEEWTQAGGSDYDRDYVIAEAIRDHIRESRPGAHFSDSLTRWYLHAVENDG